MTRSAVLLAVLLVMVAGDMVSYPAYWVLHTALQSSQSVQSVQNAPEHTKGCPDNSGWWWADWILSTGMLTTANNQRRPVLMYSSIFLVFLRPLTPTRVSYSGFCNATGMRHILFWEAQFYPQKNGNFQRCLLCLLYYDENGNHRDFKCMCFFGLFGYAKANFAKNLRFCYNSFKNLR